MRHGRSTRKEKSDVVHRPGQRTDRRRGSSSGMIGSGQCAFHAVCNRPVV